jgi:N6-L-threonylcarbamoyladenine synthase
MLVLGVESSCDDTAAAVLADGRKILANVLSSQDAIHSPYGGVVPELASRQHVKNILPVIDAALKQAGANIADLGGIAVTRGPGLVGSLLVGLSAVKAISYRWGVPYVGVNHLEAHLLAIFLHTEIEFPYLALLASGGHTLLYVVRDFGDYRYLGGTRDDAAGEAYDKVAKDDGLGIPGWACHRPALEERQCQGDQVPARAHEERRARVQLQRTQDRRVALFEGP